MLCSTPVIASDAGCSREIIDKCGFIMPKNDHYSIYNSLKLVLNFFENKKKKWHELKKHSRLRIRKNFLIKNTADKYVKYWIY